jgi:hypothetical protein
MARAAFVCPRRNDRAEDWAASEHCEDTVRHILAQSALSEVELAARASERGFDILRPYLYIPPAPEETHT